MMNRIYMMALISLLIGCGSDEQSHTAVNEQTVETQRSFNEIAKRYVEVDLEIPATEEYSIKIYRAELNNDDSSDYIVTVNRYQKAIDDAIASGKIVKHAEIGYTGKHNFFYFVNGTDLKFSPAIPVASSPHSELKISFENVTSETSKDVIVDYHLMNAVFRHYYTISNNSPLEILRNELILNLGEKDEKGFVVEFAPGSNGIGKDVLVYEAELGEYELEHQDDIYKVEPERIKSDKLVYRWLYHPTQKKFYLKR